MPELRPCGVPGERHEARRVGRRAVNSCRQVRSLVIAVNIRLEAAKGPTVARLPSDEVERECRL